MANVVVVGAQWGDEGKGKIVDWLSEQADIVVRFQGGHNAGHTLVINGETYKLALLPSGVLRPSKLAVIGNGVVFDPQAFLEEVAKLKAQGVAVSPENLRVAENVTLILPLHRELDALRESSNAVTAIGTTRTGLLTVTNVGLDPSKVAPLTINNVSVVSSDPAWTLGTGTPLAIGEPGSSATLRISFSPQRTGLSQATLIIDSNDPLHPRLEVPVAAIGRELLPCTLTVNPGEPVDFGEQESLGKCPKTQGNVYEFGTNYVCEHSVGPSPSGWRRVGRLDATSRPASGARRCCLA